ncbi:hypothetical protein BGAL_0025g00230 [Botrytis galanthina]|uniref:Uncharacterized protein n=1 Tax=Botrytis galanthina TaxID=278940 RepID=A0A4S8R8V1_9HELO|nr:hypothetical protein BGAL_0025g00230 [Botrytis galanthina]
MQYNILAMSGTTSQLDFQVAINLIIIASSSIHSDNTILPSIAHEARVFLSSQILLKLQTSKAQQRSPQLIHSMNAHQPNPTPAPDWAFKLGMIGCGAGVSELQRFVLRLVIQISVAG